MVMLELLRMQAQRQAELLSNCVLALARDPLAPEQLNACAAAARSFEGTAQTVGLEAGAELARAMEECCAAVRRGEIELQRELIGMMVQAVDLLDCMARTSPTAPPLLRAIDGEDEDDFEEPYLESARHSKGKPVLVVDDSEETRELERKLLKYQGYEVVVAADGIEAWYAVLTGDFDLVLTDVEMPLLDGIELTRRIRRDPRFERLPVLIACDKGNLQQRWRCFDAGANYYVIKGTFHDTLVEAVATLIGPARK
ncbi:response regulator [Steroidobacter sp. S1-65]|uniref:Response regulator n=1 Tax=Steroidobacter gossypii TaxID=2805490 RepID=A0ABS1WUN8_9GAMM|nr:response regulator [Steroidobacter gossypii]MBM0104685.1 response regulator [Steroidobacter gossypii]